MQSSEGIEAANEAAPNAAARRQRRPRREARPNQKSGLAIQMKRKTGSPKPQHSDTRKIKIPSSVAFPTGSRNEIRYRTKTAFHQYRSRSRRMDDLARRGQDLDPIPSTAGSPRTLTKNAFGLPEMGSTLAAASRDQGKT